MIRTDNFRTQCYVFFTALKMYMQTLNSSPGSSDLEGLCGLGVLQVFLISQQGDAMLPNTKHVLPLQHTKWAAPEFSIAVPFPVLCHSRYLAHICWMNAWGDGTFQRTSLFLFSAGPVVVCDGATSQCWLLQTPRTCFFWPKGSYFDPVGSAWLHDHVALDSHFLLKISPEMESARPQHL